MSPSKLFLYSATCVFALWTVSGIVIYCYFPPTQRGEFGDMFGAINSLFSGLAFAAVVVNLVNQQQQLKQSRADNLEMIKSQTRAVRLQALTVLFDEYTARIKNKSEEVSRYIGGLRPRQEDADFIAKLNAEQNVLLKLKHKVFEELEAAAEMGSL